MTDRLPQFALALVAPACGDGGGSGDADSDTDADTDPDRMTGWDPSAVRWNDFVGPGKTFQWITEVGEDAPATYGGMYSIDHVASDTATGSCWHAGVTDGHPNVIDAIYFDHKPAVCAISIP